MQVKRSKTTVRFGKSGDLPIAGNWDGNGTWEIGVRRPGSAKFLLRMPDGSVQKVVLGDANDVPVTGDWDGNGVTDLGVYDQATAMFTLLQTDPMGVAFTTVVPFGTPGDVPVTGDWDGNGITDLGVWSPATAMFNKRGAVAPSSVMGRVKTVRLAGPSRADRSARDVEDQAGAGRRRDAFRRLVGDDALAEAIPGTGLTKVPVAVSSPLLLVPP